MLDLTLNLNYDTNEEYQQQLLSIFKIDKYDDDIINKKLDDLYNDIKNNKVINDKMVLKAGLVMSEDPEVGLRLLFSYDSLKGFYSELKLLLCLDDSS